MEDPTRKEMLLRNSTEQIEKWYRTGRITAKHRNDLLREKAGFELEKAIEDKGYLGAIWGQSLKNLQDGWDNLKESALRTPTGSAKTELYYVGLAIWGQIQMLTSAMNAVGEVTGKVAEKQALRMGASPGLAKVIGFATDVGTGFVPIGMASKSVVKGVQGVQKKLGKKAAETAGAAGAAEKQAVAQKILTEGLEADGVKGAEKLIANTGAAGVAEKQAEDALDALRKTMESQQRKIVDEGLTSRSFDDLAKKSDELQVKIDARHDVLDSQKIPFKKQLDDPELKVLYDERIVHDTAAAQKGYAGAKAVLDDILGDLPESTVYASRESILREIYALTERSVTGAYDLAHNTARALESSETIEKLTRQIAPLILAKKAPGADFFATMESAASGFTRKGKEEILKEAEDLAKKINERITKFFFAEQQPGKAIPKAFAVNEPGARAIREAEQAIAQATQPSVAEKFVADLTRYQDEIKALTETQTHEMTAKLASKLGLSLDDLKEVVPGQALNEREMYAYLKTLEPRVQEWQTLAQRVVDEGTEQATNAFAAFTSELFQFAPKFRGAEVTAGRAVEILKESPPMKALTNMAAGWDAKTLTDTGFGGAMQTMAEDVLAMTKEAPEKAAALAAMGQSYFQRFGDKAWPMIREGYVNLLLARPITAARNFIGNSVAAANSVAERLVGGAFSADRAKGITGTEGFYLAKGMAAAIGDALSAWGKAFQKIDAGDVNKFDFDIGKIPGALGRFIRLPGDNLRGMDNFFKTLFRRGSYYAQGIREGTQKGLRGDDLATWVSRRVNHPTEAMLKEAEQFALHQTFQNELGTMGKHLQKTLQAGPLALYFPFMKTPINLTKYAWNRTPGLQLLSKSLYDDIKAGGVKADLAIGRLTLATMQGHFIWELAKDGWLTGSGPADPSMRRVWAATNERYAVKTKAGHVPISNFEPASTPIGMIADLQQVANQLDETSLGQTAMAITFAIANNLSDKTWWKTMSDLTEIASGLAYGHPVSAHLEKVALQPLITVATGGPLGSGIARVIDPVAREARTLTEEVLARTPGYSKDQPPKTDIYGDPYLPPQSISGEWLKQYWEPLAMMGLADPFTFKPHTEDRVKKEGTKVRANAPAFPWSIGGPESGDFDIIQKMQPDDTVPTPLSATQQFRWKGIYRDLLRSKKYGIERNLLDSPHYQKATKPLQNKLFTGYLSQMRSTARDMLVIEDADLGKKVLENKAAKVLPLLNEQQRAVAEPQVRQSITLFEKLTPEERANLLRWGTLETEESDE